MPGKLISRLSDKVRWALPHEGPLVQDILLDDGVALARQANWLLPIGPYWLLYSDPDVIGCVNINPGMPVGRLEWLTVRKGLTHRERAIAIRDLCYGGMAILKSQGSQFVAGHIEDTDVNWKKVIERRGLEPAAPGILYMGRL